MEKKQVGARIGRRSFISAILILLVLMIGAGLLTRLVPADEYQRTTQAGREVLDPSSFHLTAAHPLPVWRWFTGPVEVLWSSDALMVIAIIVFILLVGGSFAVLDRAGVLRTIIEHIATTFRPRRYILIAVICLFFMGMGALLGIFEEVVPLIPIIIPLAWFRIIVFAVMYCIVTLFVVTYARRIEGNPSSSLVYAEERAVRARYQESIDHTETEAPRRAVVWAVSCLMAMLVIILMGPFVCRAGRRIVLRNRVEEDVRNVRGWRRRHGVATAISRTSPALAGLLVYAVTAGFFVLAVSIHFGPF
jgi:uncharacterized ion transporter superfamily protein YfcC